MPWKTRWHSPRLYCEDCGVKIYCTYKNDNWDEQERYGFTVDPQYRNNGDPEYDGKSFDVRTLHTIYHDEVMEAMDEWDDDFVNRFVMRRAIKDGLIEANHVSDDIAEH